MEGQLVAVGRAALRYDCSRSNLARMLAVR